MRKVVLGVDSGKGGVRGWSQRRVLLGRGK